MSAATAPGVCVVIPTRNGARYLRESLPAIFRQKEAGRVEVVLVDSGSEDDTRKVAAGFDAVRVATVDRFTHGRARNIGVAASRSDVVVFLSQDAGPANERWLAELTAPLTDPAVGAAYSRQLPRPDAPPHERFFLATYFPAGAAPVERPPGADLTFLTTFFSNVSSAVTRRVASRYPFREDLVMSEDRQFALELHRGGFRIEYCPRSVVVHSHRHSAIETFRRHFDSAYSAGQIFAAANERCRRGGAHLGYTVRELRHVLSVAPWRVPAYGLYLAAKWAGLRMGARADALPRWLCRRASTQPGFWERRA